MRPSYRLHIADLWALIKHQCCIEAKNRRRSLLKAIRPSRTAPALRSLSALFSHRCRSFLPYARQNRTERSEEPHFQHRRAPWEGSRECAPTHSDQKHRDCRCGWTHHQHCHHPLWTAPSVSALTFCNRWFRKSYLLPIADVNCTHIDVSRDINIVRDHYIVLSTIVSISLVLGLVINLNLIQQLRVQPRSSSTCRSSILYHMRLERVRIWVK